MATFSQATIISRLKQFLGPDFVETSDPEQTIRINFAKASTALANNTVWKQFVQSVDKSAVLKEAFGLTGALTTVTSSKSLLEQARTEYTSALSARQESRQRLAGPQPVSQPKTGVTKDVDPADRVMTNFIENTEPFPGTQGTAVSKRSGKNLSDRSGSGLGAFTSTSPSGSSTRGGAEGFTRTSGTTSQAESADRLLRQRKPSTSTTSGGGGAGGGGGDGGGDMRISDGLGPMPEYHGDDQMWTNVPSDGELWKVDGKWALAYKSDVRGPYVYYFIPDDATFKRIFPGGRPRARTLTGKEADRMGAISPGSVNLLTLDLGKNWEEGFNTTIEREALTSPWLKDGEVVATLLAATLEGRAVTEADLERTKWFANRSKSEVQYLVFSSTASKDELKQYKDKFSLAVREALIEAGVRDPDKTLVNFMSSKWATGQWSESFLAQQVLTVSNPFSALAMDPELKKVVKGVSLDTLATATKEVEAKVKEWLGPQHARGYSKEWYRQWAGAMQDDPNAENDLIDHLKGQRLSLYPEYKNANLKYSDIAPVWENEMRRVWGQTAVDDTSWGVLDRVIRANDQSEAGRILRREGLRLNIDKVQEDAMSGLNEAFGGQVVNA